MKKQLLALLVGISMSQIQSVTFYVINDGDIPITASLYVKGVIGPWDKTFTLNRGEYAEFNTLAYCGKSFTIRDGRQANTVGAGDQIIPDQTIEIPFITSCHQYQKLTVTTPLKNTDQTEQYYAIFGKQHGDFATSYQAATDSGDRDAWIADRTKVS